MLGKFRSDQPKKLNIPWSGEFILTLYWHLCLRPFLKKDNLNDYDFMVKYLDSPFKVMAWLFCNVEYAYDVNPEDHWMDPKLFFTRRLGDCEDWAIFAMQCLHSGKYLCMYRQGSGHCTYLYKTKDGGFGSLGTYGLRKHVGSIPGIIPDWEGYEDWTRYNLFDKNRNRIDSGVNLDIQS